VAQRIDPGLVERLAAQLGRGSVIVTGTNGKTTTSRMLAAIASEGGTRPLANPSGSNLMRGVATALLQETDAMGRVRDAADRLGVIEVDEATVPEAVRALKPRAIVFTNLFRDQLDRYGEVDTVAALWRATVATLPPETTLILNADDPAVASLSRNAPCRVVTYGIEDTRVAGEELEHASDYRFCLVCGEELTYTAVFIGHAGHWRCAACGNTRPEPDVRATCVELAADAAKVTIAAGGNELHAAIALAGLYNAENALAAAAAGIALGFERSAIERALSSFRAAFGRQERFEIDGRSVLVLLGKNPTGMNQVLRTIASQNEGPLHLLLFLNDGTQDGRDISWIWDTDYELLAGRAADLVVAGTRAPELALRLKYAGILEGQQVIHNAARALAAAIARTPAGEMLYIVPTYTAMIEVRELLAKQGQRARFWEDV
jgi:UDP-N-acetylmuramyl tripeptide synthase